MDIKEFYSKHIDMEQSKESGEEIRTLCPCHNDSNASFSINTNTGFYHCFSPGCKLSGGGSIQKFLSIIEDVSMEEAKAKINELMPPPKAKKSRKSKKELPVSQEDVDKRMLGLHNHPDRVHALSEKTFWTLDTMKRYEIGYDAQEGRYWIPIKEHGKLVNIRKYAPDKDPKMIQITGHSEPRVFPYENLQERELVIMEGEKDCILANQHGFPAITFTAGAGTFKAEWKQFFSQRDVVVCYDIDDAGRSGANKIAQNLLSVARSVRIVELPITTPENGDYTDYISQGATPQDFRALIEESPKVEKESSGPVDIPDEVTDLDLGQIAEQAMFYRRIRSNVRIIGKDTAPSLAPEAMTVSCNRDNSKACFVCELSNRELQTDSVRLDETTAEILQLIECSVRDRKNIIREIFQISANCKRFKTKETNHQGIMRCSAIPSIDNIKVDHDSYNQKYVEREILVMGATVEANVDYEIESIAMPDPKNQSLVHLAYKVKPADSSIEEFRLTPELKEQLEVFCVNRRETE